MVENIWPEMTWFSSYIDDDTAEVLDVRLAEGDEEDAILDYSINVNVASHLSTDSYSHLRFLPSLMTTLA